MLGERERRRAGEDLAGLRGGLQPGGRVHDRPGHEELPGRTDARGGLAGLDTDPDVEGLIEPELRGEPTGVTPDRESRPYRPRGVVLVDVRQPEHRHHGVADELLGLAAERTQLLGHGVVEAAEHLPCALGVEALRERGRLDQVGEEHRDELAFLGAER